MKQGRVVELSGYRAERLIRQRLTQAGARKALPAAGYVWELLDRNICLELWKRGL